MLPIVILGAGVFFGLGAKLSSLLFGILGLLLLIIIVALIALWNWTTAASTLAISKWNTPFGIKEAFKEGKKFIAPMVLTAFLMVFINLGSVLFFVIPAMIFSVWFIFWQYFVVLENRSSLNALHASREIVRGRFWGIVWRLIVIHLPELVVGILIGSLSRSESGPANGGFQLISVMLQPFYFAYTYVLFTHLRKTTKDISTTVPQSNKLLYLGLPLVGYILAIVAGVLILPSAFRTLVQVTSTMAQQQEATSPKELQSSTKIVNGLVMYYLTNKKFPMTLDEVTDEKTLPFIPSEGRTGLPYRYTQLSNGLDFRLCTPLEVKPEKCVTAQSKNFDL